MELTVHLFKAEATDFSDLIDPEKKPQQVTLRRELSVPCAAWLVPGRPHPPSWAGAVEPLIDASGLTNSSSSLLLALRVRDRFFAVTFGYANSLLRDDLLEPEFGLRVSANAADPDRIAAMQARTVNENSRQMRSQTANRSRVADFGLETEREWLRYLRGDVLSGADIARSVGGSQSLSLNTKKTIVELPELLDWLYDQFTSDAYKTKFPYLDNVAAVTKGAGVLVPLNKALASAISDPASHHVGVASPDDLMGAEVQYYKIAGDGVRGRGPLEELSTEQVLDIVATSPSDSPLQKLKITPFDPNDVRIRPAKKVYDYLVFETDLDGSKYVLCLGRWFKVSASYVEEVDGQIAKLADVTSEMSLPDWPLSEHWKEARYNQTVADARGWLLMDKKDIRGIGGPYQKVEVCDLLTGSSDFICIKKMEKSATLSHLFSQAAVSATLYWEHEGYRKRVLEHWKEKWPDKEISGEPRMVMAIATERAGNLQGLLYFFSKVNLVQRLADIRNSRFQPALAKINR